jgi:hypothetical protein
VAYDVAKKLPEIDLDDSTLLRFRQACVFVPFVKGLRGLPRQPPGSYRLQPSRHCSRRRIHSIQQSKRPDNRFGAFDRLADVVALGPVFVL